MHPEGKLISIGLISEDGREFYAELVDNYTQTDCNEFVIDTVLPLLGDGQKLRWHELIVRLGGWIEDFEQPVTIATDSMTWDWDWIWKLFTEPGTWPDNLNQQSLLLTMNYIHDYDKFTEAIERAFERGLRRHHALDDARANRIGWAASENMKFPGEGYEMP